MKYPSVSKNIYVLACRMNDIRARTDEYLWDGTQLRPLSVEIVLNVWPIIKPELSNDQNVRPYNKSRQRRTRPLGLSRQGSCLQSMPWPLESRNTRFLRKQLSCYL